MNTKKPYTVTIDEKLLEIFNEHVKSKGFNKSALAEIWMRDWLIKEAVKLDDNNKNTGG
jgi:hypothetical protein